MLISVCGITRFDVDRTHPKTGTVTRVIFSGQSIDDWLPVSSKTRPTPTVDELKARLKEEVIARPYLQRTRLDDLVDELDFEYIFTPPYTPNLQPIETVWGVVKNKVASQYVYGRNIEQLREQTLEAFDTVSSDTVTGILKKITIPFANELIQKIESLDGDIFNLTEK